MLEYVEILLLELTLEDGSEISKVVVLVLKIEVVLVKGTGEELALRVYVTERLVDSTVRLVETELVPMEIGTLLERIDRDEVKFAEDKVAVDTKVYALVKFSVGCQKCGRLTGSCQWNFYSWNARLDTRRSRVSI